MSRSAGNSTVFSYDLSGNTKAIQSSTGVSPTIVSQPVVQTAPSNSPVSFSIDASSPTPVTYQWQFNGSNILGATGDTLYLPSATLANEGSYTVVVTNAQGSVTSAAATLSIATTEVVAWGHNETGAATVPTILNHVTAIAAGELHSLALNSDGTVSAWGDDSYHQIEVPSYNDIRAIAAGPSFSLALRSNGTVIGWGNNDWGQITPPAGLSSVVGIAAGGYAAHGYSMALKSDGTVVGWGIGPALPTWVNDAVAIAAGKDCAMVLQGTGSVLAFSASNSFGQATVPPGLSNVVAIAAGQNHNLALKSDGTVVAWGDNTYQQISIPPGLGSVVAISAGDYYSMALLANGTVVTWGDDGSSLAPPPIGLSNVMAIAAGGQHSLALLGTDPRTAQPVILNPVFANGGAGSAFQYQIRAKNNPASYTASGLPPGLSLNAATGLISGTPTTAGVYTMTLSATNSAGTSQQTVITLTLNSATPIFTSGAFALVQYEVPFSFQVTASDSPTSYRASGLPSGLTINTATGVISGLANSVGTFPVILTADNGLASNTMTLTLSVQRVIGWGGSNNFGQNSIPTSVDGSVVAIASRSNHCLALKSDGTVLAWGQNDRLQSTVPSSLAGVVAIAAGDSHSLALKSDGTIITWGSNASGQRTLPSNLGQVIAIAAGTSHSLALRADGTVVAWGLNSSGQTSVPAGLTNVVAIAAGDNFSLALKGDGTVAGWGENTYGQATPPSGLSNVTAIAAGYDICLALKADGTVTIWGSYFATTPANNGVGMPALNTAVAIASGFDFGFALRSNGTVSGGGDNWIGQVSGATGMTNVVAVSGGSDFGLALLSAQPATTLPVFLNAPFALAGVGNGFNYRVAVRNGATSFSAAGLPSGMSMSQNTGVISGTPGATGAYTITLAAANAAGTSTQSWRLTVLPPAGPAGLTVSQGFGQLGSTWTASPLATSYSLKRATASGGPYSTIASLTGTSYTDTGLANGVTYYYVVTAQTSYGESLNSLEASGTPANPAPRTLLKFDEASGASAADSSGNGWNGTLNGGASFAAGKINNALSLSGSSQYVSLPAGVVSGVSDFTISAWVKLNSVSNWSRIFDFGTGTVVNMYLTPTNSSTGKVRYTITTGGEGSAQRIDGAAALPSGTWTNVAVTLSGSTGTLYVNGTPVGTNSNMTVNPSSLGSTNLNYIGKSQYSDPYLNGLVDDFRIYGRALGGAEVAALVSPPAASGAASATTGNAQVSLSWAASPGASSYNVKRSTTSGSGYSSIATGITGASYVDTSVTNGVTYYYVVTAVSPGGESGNSPETSTKPYAPIAASELVPPVVALNGASAQLTMPSVLGRIYQLQRSASLAFGSWVNVGAAQTGTGNVLSFGDSGSGAGGNRMFYRVLIQP